MTTTDVTDAATRPAVPERVPWRDVVVFYLLACGLAWAVDLPLWLSGRGLHTPLAGLPIVASMYTPAVAALIVVWGVQRTPRRQVLRRLGWWPIRPVGRTLRLAAVGLAGGILLPIAAVFVASAFGLIRLDLVHFSGFAHLIAAQLPAGTTLPLPIQLLVLLQLVQLPIGALINGLATLGEETGWRGFLLPALRPLGTWPALLISGALWGLWHAPVILLGYDFDEPNLLGLGLMIVACVGLGVLVGWLRIRSANIWPGVIAHGAINAASGFYVLVVAAGTSPNLLAASPLGWVGWLLLAATALALVLGRRYPNARGWAAPADARGDSRVTS